MVECFDLFFWINVDADARVRVLARRIHEHFYKRAQLSPNDDTKHTFKVISEGNYESVMIYFSDGCTREFRFGDDDGKDRYFGRWLGG